MIEASVRVGKSNFGGVDVNVRDRRIHDDRGVDFHHPAGGEEPTHLRQRTGAPLEHVARRGGAPVAVAFFHASALMPAA